MDIKTIRFNGVIFGFQSDQHAAEFAECFATSEKAEALGAATPLAFARTASKTTAT
jgi:hypothetical protein